MNLDQLMIRLDRPAHATSVELIDARTGCGARAVFYPMAFKIGHITLDVVRLNLN